MLADYEEFCSGLPVDQLVAAGPWVLRACLSMAPTFQGSPVPTSFLSRRISCLYLLKETRLVTCLVGLDKPCCQYLGLRSPDPRPTFPVLVHMPPVAQLSSAIVARTSSCARSRSSSAWRGDTSHEPGAV